MKEQINTPEKELSNEEIVNLQDAEFAALVIRMLTEMVEYGHKIEEKVKAMQNEVKKNIQGIMAWTELESNMISEISRAVKDKYRMISPISGT